MNQKQIILTVFYILNWLVALGAAFIRGFPFSDLPFGTGIILEILISWIFWYLFDNFNKIGVQIETS